MGVTGQGAVVSRTARRAIERAACSRLFWACAGASAAIVGAGMLAFGTKRGRAAVAPLIVQSLLGPVPHGVPRRAYAVGSAVHSGVPANEALWYLSPEWREEEEVPVRMTSADGTLRLAGWERFARDAALAGPCESYGGETAHAAASKRWVVLVHGWRGFHGEVEMLAQVWTLLGWNVLSVDLRAHGDSEGAWAGMSAPDAADVAAWAADLVRRYGEDVRIVLHGHSMGGATVAGAAADAALPSQVEAVIADCAFTSAHAMFDELARSAIPLRSMRTRLFEAARKWLLEQGGYDLALASPLDRVRAARVPILFVHGTADNFVPPWMSGALFDACAAPLKWLHFVEGAGHCESMRRDSAGYFGTVLAFLDAARAGKIGAAIV